MQAGPSFKVILVGDSGTGKTSLIRKYIHGTFQDEYEVTVGVDFSSKTVMIDQQSVQLQIWDTCGQDVYKSITTNFYRGAAAIFLVYSVDNQESFNHLRQWYEEFSDKGSSEAFVFLIGAKCDLQAQVDPQQALTLMKEVKGAFLIETSSKTDSKVGQLFHKAADTMFKCYRVSQQFRELVKPDRLSLPTSYQPRKVTVDNFQKKTEKKKCCA